MRHRCHWVWWTILLGCSVRTSVAAQVLITNFPVADAFVRSIAPTNNYGGAGSLAVSGSIATNALGQQNGLLDTFLRFDLSSVISNLDNSFGAGNWVIARARLYLFEQGAPNNVVFNRGVGPCEVRWIANDTWAEGTGSPNAPTTDGVVWTNEVSLLNSNVDQSLGSFTNGGTDGVVRATLGMPASFVADVAAGGLVGFFLTATTNSAIGFTFHSRSFVDPTQWPFLEIAAAAIPKITSVVMAGGDMKIGFNTSGGVTNTVEYNNDLASTNWNTLAGVLGTGGNTNILDTGGAALPRRFYRVKLVLEEQ